MTDVSSDESLEVQSHDSFVAESQKDLSEAASLTEKLNIVWRYDDCVLMRWRPVRLVFQLNSSQVLFAQIRFRL